MNDLGSLKRLDPREIWSKEASEFTPWLAENLNALGEALGLDLELQSTEAPVGDFSVDILARDLNRNRLVIIENQLSPTDHDHLGKLLTYASGYNATTVVWIAPQIRDEHRQALDWLNQHTDTDTDFFGVVVEILQIDDSRPAVNFKPVATPNEWRKTKARTSGGGAASPRAEAYRAFFQELIDELREQHRFTGARIAQPQSWYSFASGYSGITYAASFAKDGQVRAELYIDRGDETANKELFDQLKSQREEVETRFGEPLRWERLDDKRACRIAVYRDGHIKQSPEELAEIRTWLVDRLLALKEVFGPRIAKQ
jgi:hypothetical protein